MFNKTLFIAGSLLPFLLIAKINAVLADEPNKLEVVAETNEEHPIVEIETKAETPRPRQNTNGTDQKSIKMIVGGQSKDGVAKSIDLPVDAK